MDTRDAGRLGGLKSRGKAKSPAHAAKLRQALAKARRLRWPKKATLEAEAQIPYALLTATKPQSNVKT